MSKIRETGYAVLQWMDGSKPEQGSFAAPWGLKINAGHIAVFETKAEAEDHARNLCRKFHLQYRVVKVDVVSNGEEA